MSVEVTGQLHLVINHEGRGLCGFVHVKFNCCRAYSPTSIMNLEGASCSDEFIKRMSLSK